MKIFSLVVLFISLNAYSISDTLFIPQNQYQISVTPLVLQNLKIDHFGEKILKSKNSSSIGFYLGRKSSLFKGSYLRYGIGISRINYSYLFSFEAISTNKSIVSTQHEHHSKEQSIFFYSIPISITYEIFSKNKRQLYIELGASLIFIPEYHVDNYIGYFVDNGGTANIFDMYLTNYDMNQKRFLSYQVKLGMEKITKKVHSWSYALVFSYNPKSIARGTYSFNYMPFESYGNVEQRISYLGVEFTFGLTTLKKVRIPN